MKNQVWVDEEEISLAFEGLKDTGDFFFFIFMFDIMKRKI